MPGQTSLLRPIWEDANRVECAGGCGQTVHRTTARYGTGMCRLCAAQRLVKERVLEDGTVEFWCPRCEAWKAEDDFYRDRSRPLRGRMAHCKPCVLTQQREQRKVANGRGG